MPTSSIADILAPASFCQLTDAEGRLILLPAATVDHFRQAGHSTVTLTIALDPGRPARPARPWLTLREAATLHVTDVDGMNLHRAEVKIGRACDSGAVKSERIGQKRRIEPDSLDAWRLAERERNLNEEGD